MELFDSHAHLDDEKFNQDREEVIKEIAKEVKTIISAGYSLEGSKMAIELSKKYDIKFLYIDFRVGEIGLDYYWNKENKELQKKAFIAQIKLANELNLPIMIHTREAIMDTIEILKQNPVAKKGVFHCCPLNRELVKEALKIGFYISFAGPVTFKNSKNADEIIKMVPNDRMLIETDSPYLSPEPLRGKRNDSRNLKYIAEKIANVKGIAIEEVANLTYDNTCRIYNKI